MIISLERYERVLRTYYTHLASILPNEYSILTSGAVPSELSNLGPDSSALSASLNPDWRIARANPFGDTIASRKTQTRFE